MLSTVNHNSNIRFGKALNDEQQKKYIEVADKAKKALGADGRSMLLVHDVCLPQYPEKNTGVGHLSSEESLNYFKLMKTYLGINTVEVMPPGQMKAVNGNYYSPYGSTALSLGDHQINPYLLTTPKFGEILKKEEFNDIVRANNASDKDTIANCKNVIGENTPQDKALKKAFARFNSSNDTEVKKLKTAFVDYKDKNKDWLEPKGIFEFLQKHHGSDYPKEWNKDKAATDKKLYDSTYDKVKREARINEIKSKHNGEIEFFKFKQFIADEHLKAGREKLKKEGLELFGDCLIGFSHDEAWANPNAFKKDAHGEIALDPTWGMPDLDLDSIKDSNSNSDCAKLLKRKVGLFAERYDGLRLDASWRYDIIQNAEEQGTGHRGGVVLDLIDKAVEEVQKENYKPGNVIQEFECGPNVSGHLWEMVKPEVKDSNGNVIEKDVWDMRKPIKDRVKTITGEFIADDWASTEAFDKRGISRDSYILNPASHDSLPVKMMANNNKDEIGKIVKPDKLDERFAKNNGQQAVLERRFKLPKGALDNKQELARARMAEPMGAKHHMVFFKDVTGEANPFNSQSADSVTDFRHKIPYNNEHVLHESLQKGDGFNAMDAYERVMRADGLNETHKNLFDAVVEQKNLLNEQGETTYNQVMKLPEEVHSPLSPRSNAANELKKNKNFKPAVIAFGAVALVGAGFLLYQNYKKKQEDKKSEVKSTN